MLVEEFDFHDPVHLQSEAVLMQNIDWRLRGPPVPLERPARGQPKPLWRKQQARVGKNGGRVRWASRGGKDRDWWKNNRQRYGCDDTKTQRWLATPRIGGEDAREGKQWMGRVGNSETNAKFTRKESISTSTKLASSIIVIVPQE